MTTCDADPIARLVLALIRSGVGKQPRPYRLLRSDDLGWRVIHPPITPRRPSPTAR